MPRITHISRGLLRPKALKKLGLFEVVTTPMNPWPGLAGEETMIASVIRIGGRKGEAHWTGEPEEDGAEQGELGAKNRYRSPSR
jgi:hypothetical protein